MQRRKRGHEEGWLLSYADLITNLLLFFVVLLSAANLSKGKMEQIAKAISGEEQPESLSSIQAEIEKKIIEQKLEGIVQSKLKDEGLELSLNSGFVFDSGHAIIRRDFEAALDSMLLVLKPYSEKYNFAIEGHTDATPVLPSSQFPSNWELSAARAIVVRARLEGIGIDRARIRVEGYADTKPLPATELAALPPGERDARLRRVVVRIY
ncbi:MAG: flagellar motor protein MotB [Deltaproteobacteria bacterium]|nr:flagellar motor protein MotB [Deltaproteobacteria bacterium]